MDVAHKRGAEAVDEELDRLISKRASQDRRPDPDAEHELWKASVRAYNTRTREARRISWHEYHRDQAERLRRAVEPLIAFHEGRATELLGAPAGNFDAPGCRHRVDTGGPAGAGEGRS